MNPFYYIGNVATACGLIFVGWGGEGILHQLCLIMGGLNFGHTLTVALNYTETKGE